MGTGRRKSALMYIPGYKNNAVLQLIIVTSVAYLMLAISWALIMIIYTGSDLNFREYFIPNVALGSLAIFKTHWWTIFTYGWFQYPNSFWELLSNMLWLYCFGSVVQMLVGHKQIIPLYAFSLVTGGIFYVLAQLLPGTISEVNPAFLGCRAGLMGLAIAAITISPNYRFYITETFTIPLMLVTGVFVMLMMMGTINAAHFTLPILIMLMAGGTTGFTYVRLLKAGYQPAEWAYRLGNRIEGLVTPAEKVILKQQKSPSGQVYEPKQGITQSRIDEILDKINQKGYNSLSKEEKEMLLRAGRE